MKSKILIVNKFYYPRGGDCICAINLENLLRRLGYEVAVFAMQYPENIASEWSRYFASEVKFSGGLGNKLRGVSRALGMGDINQSFKTILRDFKPDIVHLNNIHSYLSPRLAELAKRAGARVVWTLHDYKLICPAYTCRRGSAICEECFTKKSSVLRNRCMKGSLAASAIGWLEAVKWNRRRLEKSVDAFICPSRFMRDKMIEAGYSEEKLHTVCNFVDSQKLEALSAAEPATERQPYACYAGRLSEEKGVVTMLRAFARLPYTLKVAGDGALFETLKTEFKQNPNIVFLGHCNALQVSELLANATISVIPSEWYENNPLGVIESLCAGTPVVGARIGGIPELIDPESGIRFESGDADDLSRAVTEAFARQWDNQAIAERARRAFSAERHLDQLFKIYSISSHD